MSENGIEFTTPVGRIVWGHPSKVKPVLDSRTKQPKLNAQGQPRQETAFGLAIPIADFQQGVWPYLQQEAATMYPNPPRDFAWKFTQEGELDKNNVPYGQRDGYAGHVVLAVKTELNPPAVFKFDPQTNQYRQMQPDELKAGDYVRVGINAKVHAGESPGLYINPLAVEHIGYGTAIVGSGAADPMALFGGQQVALPAGASATPIGGAPGGVGMPGMGGMPQQPMQPAAQSQGMPQMGGMPGQAPMGNGAPPAMNQGTPMGHAGAMGAAGGMPTMGAPANMAGQPNAGYAQPAPGNMPPPATDFIPGAPGQPAPGGMGMPGQGGPLQGGQMPGMPSR